MRLFTHKVRLGFYRAVSRLVEAGVRKGGVVDRLTHALALALPERWQDQTWQTFLVIGPDRPVYRSAPDRETLARWLGAENGGFISLGHVNGAYLVETRRRMFEIERPGTTLFNHYLRYANV